MSSARSAKLEHHHHHHQHQHHFIAWQSIDCNCKYKWNKYIISELLYQIVGRANWTVGCVGSDFAQTSVPLFAAESRDDHDDHDDQDPMTSAATLSFRSLASVLAAMLGRRLTLARRRRCPGPWSTSTTPSSPLWTCSLSWTPGPCCCCCCCSWSWRRVAWAWWGRGWRARWGRRGEAPTRPPAGEAAVLMAAGSAWAAA